MANSGQIVAAFRDIAATKDLSPEEVNDLIQDGITAGLAKIYGPNVEAEIFVDEEEGDIDIIVLKRVVEEVEDESSEISLREARWDDPGYEVGDIMEIPVDFNEFGRNAVMAAKQRIVQRVREGERQRIRDEFQDRIGELLSGEVQQIERGKIVIMLNRARNAEAIIPWKDQNPRERFRQGDPIRAVLKKVDETPKGPRLILSRAAPDFVSALFKLEVPEVYQGIVEIKSIAREVGGRTKMAVSSRDESVDPVGACVGLRGSRVQAVVSELGGERIDIVPWHPDPEIFARRALAPAKVAKVMSDPETKVITAIVDEDQLSLAIGRNGQNVRLASQLIGWQIDLYGSREWLERGADTALFGDVSDEAMEMADFPIEELELPDETLAALQGAGYDTFLDIIDLDRSDFVSIDDISEDAADDLLALIDELTIVEEEVEEEPEASPSAEDEVEEEAPESEGEEAPEAGEAAEEEEDGEGDGDEDEGAEAVDEGVATAEASGEDEEGSDEEVSEEEPVAEEAPDEADEESVEEEEEDERDDG